MATFISNSAAETEALGVRFAEDVGVGSVLALQGELGSGKTLFTRGFVAGMGSKTAVASPTFTIVHEYRDGLLLLSRERENSCAGTFHSARQSGVVG